MVVELLLENQRVLNSVQMWIGVGDSILCVVLRSAGFGASWPGFKCQLSAKQ